MLASVRACSKHSSFRSYTIRCQGTHHSLSLSLSLSLTDWLTWERNASSKCGHDLSGPHSVSQSARVIIILIRFECLLCGHFFPVRHSLERHIRNVHHPVKHECPFCGVVVIHLVKYLMFLMATTVEQLPRDTSFEGSNPAAAGISGRYCKSFTIVDYASVWSLT